MDYMQLARVWSFYRDIKTLNIFMGRSGLLKLGDFGISRMLGDVHMAETVRHRRLLAHVHLVLISEIITFYLILLLTIKCC